MKENNVNDIKDKKIFYTVKKNDNLNKIVSYHLEKNNSKKALEDEVFRIAKINNLKDPSKIEIGMLLDITSLKKEFNSIKETEVVKEIELIDKNLNNNVSSNYFINIPSTYIVIFIFFILFMIARDPKQKYKDINHTRDINNKQDINITQDILNNIINIMEKNFDLLDKEKINNLKELKSIDLAKNKNLMSKNKYLLEYKKNIEIFIISIKKIKRTEKLNEINKIIEKMINALEENYNILNIEKIEYLNIIKKIDIYKVEDLDQLYKDILEKNILINNFINEENNKKNLTKENNKLDIFIKNKIEITSEKK